MALKQQEEHSLTKRDHHSDFSSTRPDRIPNNKKALTLLRSPRALSAHISKNDFKDK